ncbi:MAG: glycosyltransferase family 9 protein [Candidatus Acidoferrales bacterium]
MIREFPIEFKFHPNPAAPHTTVTTAQKLLCHFERFLPRPPGKPDPTARRFLLWSVVQLGDVVLDLAAARAIKRRFPDARVTMVVQRKLAAFAALEPSLDRVRGYDPRWFTRVDQHRDALRESLRLRRELATEQVAFVLDPHPLSRLFLRSTRIPWLVGCAQASSCLSLSLPVQAGRHRLEEKLALLEAAGIPAQPGDVALSIPESARRGALEFLRGAGWQGEKLLAVCPGAGSPRKCWPPERFAAAVNVFSPQTGYCVLVLGSPDDRSRADALVQRLQSSPINLAGKTTVATAAALLAHCHLVLTNDSGAMHLAAALGRPTVALFGPTDPSQWGPRGPGQSIVLRSPTGRMEDLSIDPVVAAVRQQLAQAGDPTDLARMEQLKTGRS